jgi:uncharacterized protein
MPATEFLTTLAEAGALLALVNARTNETAASGVELAMTRRTRRQGLLGRHGLAPSSALILAPCFAIHTAFMRFAIDVLFLDRGGRVLRIVHDLPPWRVAAASKACAVVELAAGSLRGQDFAVGDAVYVVAARHRNSERIPLLRPV